MQNILASPGAQDTNYCRGFRHACIFQFFEIRHRDCANSKNYTEAVLKELGRGFRVRFAGDSSDTRIARSRCRDLRQYPYFRLYATIPSERTPFCEGRKPERTRPSANHGRRKKYRPASPRKKSVRPISRPRRKARKKYKSTDEELKKMGEDLKKMEKDLKNL